MSPRVWLALPLLSSLFAAACSSTTENPGSGGATGGGGSAGSAGSSSGGTGGGGTLAVCLVECEKTESLAALKSYRAQLNQCKCQDNECQAPCASLCAPGDPSLECVQCPGTSNCMGTLCQNECLAFSTCLTSCLGI